jgi:hypothetical protein
LVRFDTLSISNNFARGMKKRHHGFEFNTKVVGELLQGLVAWLIHSLKFPNLHRFVPNRSRVDKLFQRL